MTQASKKPAKKAAAKKAAENPAPEAPDAEAPAVEDSPSIGNAAPLEPPAETEGDGADEPAADAAAADAVESEGQEPDADEQGPSEDQEPDEDGEDGEKRDSAAEGQEPDADSQAPRTAVTEPPVEKPRDEGEKSEPTSLTDAAAARLRRGVTKQQALVRDTEGNPVDTDGLFIGPDPMGQMIATKRLHQHTTQTAFERPVTTLLIAEGQRISPLGASRIVNRINAEKREALRCR